jgi:hypothetical protein
MAETTPRSPVRVGEPGRPYFQLRRGEEGISVFDPVAVDPPLSEAEILAHFRSGSQVAVRDVGIIESKGLRVIVREGGPNLSERLRLAHREIVAGLAMTRRQFKDKLKELE